MNEAKHLDEGKLGLQWILSMSGLEDVAKVGDYGSKKYTQGNWRGGSSWMRFAGSCTRHLYRYISGELLDNESHLPHLAHCAYDCLILLTWAREGKGTDDRPIVGKATNDRPKAPRSDFSPQTPWGSSIATTLSADYFDCDCEDCNTDTYGDCEIIE
jgi:hypothetical protein